jgi:protein required for attachment to host cells
MQVSIERDSVLKSYKHLKNPSMLMQQQSVRSSVNATPDELQRPTKSINAQSILSAKHTPNKLSSNLDSLKQQKPHEPLKKYTSLIIRTKPKTTKVSAKASNNGSANSSVIR